MNNIIKALTLLFVFIITYIGVNAQTTLTLKDACTYALKNKAEAIKANLDVENANYQIQEVRANVFPQINGAVGLTNNMILQQMALDFGGQTQIIKMGVPWQSNAVVQLDQQLFNMSVFQGLRAAKTTKEFYQINANLTEEQIIEKVANAYFDVYKTKSQIKTISLTLENTSKVQEVISNMVSNGIAKQIDLDRINVSLNNLRSSKSQLENALELQENALKYLIGMDMSVQIVFPDNLFDEKPKLVPKEEVNLENRTEVQLLQKQGDLLRLNKSSINAARYPTLGLSANYGYLSMGDAFPYFTDANSGVNRSDFSSVSLNLRIPIFNGFAIHSKSMQAEISIRKLETDLMDTKRALKMAAENAYTQIKNALISLGIQEANMQLAEEVLYNIQNNYHNGLASLTDVLDAQNAYANAQNNYTVAFYEYKIAEVQWKKTKGELRSFYIEQ
ncbi:MAG: TolC family protein [Bacteroidetes bacterium]|nr:TolC family protein [Bacteroidota bacterium]